MNWRQLFPGWRVARQPPAFLPRWLGRWFSIRAFGNRGEDLAARYLRQQGFQILARQYRTPLGEIDLIARDDGWIVFVEVKTRRSQSAGHPVEAVDRAKQAQLTRLALAYLKRKRWLDRPARFDIVAILWSDESQPPEIMHYRNAFPPIGRGQMFS